MTPSAPRPIDLPALPRVRRVNDRPVRRDGEFVLYWMIAARRPSFNFAIDRAVEWARALKQPLVILEALRVDYPWASDRLHRFIMDGMIDNTAAFERSPALYYPYIERRRGAGRGLLEALGRHASLIVTDEYPCFFLPRAVEAAGRRLSIRLESVDSNGILPLQTADRAFTAAVHFRRHAQRQLREQLLAWPRARPFAAARLPRLSRLPRDIERRWPRARVGFLRSARTLAGLPLDHAVAPVGMKGGPIQARKRLTRFVGTPLDRYHVEHRHPDARGTSRLSPFLHFGHISTHEIFDAVMRHEGWSARKLALKATGQREGWWGVRPGAEAFLDQLIVWRELAFNTCAKRPEDYERFESLSAWARETLARHRNDQRPFVYTPAQFEEGATHDAVWNAAQQEMRREGWFHNSMRMLWGKKILEWSPSAERAIETMIAIMNRWSLDGRDPNSYAGCFWTLGRYDRPWPERPIYGKVRSMSSQQTVRKLRIGKYVRRYARR